MKPTALPLVCSALLFAIPAAAQSDRNPADNATLAIIQTETVVFPLRLLNSTVMHGDAKVAIDVDQEGKLVDWLVTGYSRKEFADAAVEALRVWRYVPPSINGRPWASVRELHFDFSRTGVVVNFSGSDALSNRMESLMSGNLAYRTHTLRDLDRIPTPVHVVSPLSPAPESTGNGSHMVSVEFYIDEQGRVRLPSVARSAADSLYAASALAAVRQWRFDPPTVKGKPVLVLVTQEFNFVPRIQD